MLQKIDHIGVAVPDLEAAVASYRQLFGVEPSHREVVESDGVETVMFEVGESRIELLGATGPDSKIAGFLAKRGGGIPHVAYGVEDVQGQGPGVEIDAAVESVLLVVEPHRGLPVKGVEAGSFKCASRTEAMMSIQPPQQTAAALLVSGSS